MSTAIFAAMLASALLHATWNAWVKSRPDPYGALVALGIGAAWPNLLLLAWNGVPEHAAWGWIALTIALSVPAQALLGSAYREGDFAVAYPVVRGLNPVVIATAAVFVYGEQLALPKALGVGCVSAGIALLGWEAVKRSKTVTLRGLSFAGLSALATASGALTDSLGARAANDPLSYGPLIAIGNAAAMAAYQVRRVDLARVVAENWRIAALGSLISTASYQLLVWSVSRAPVALVVSLRETSMLFAVAIGAFVLRERVGAWRWLAVAIVFAGVLLIRA
ncbi:MAG TPA: DMT family transporter [Myxococcota bacterium]